MAKPLYSDLALRARVSIFELNLFKVSNNQVIDLHRKILVTGANGFVGRAIVNHLSLQSDKIFRAVRSEKKNNCANTYLIGNINSKTNWQEAIRGIDTVIHLAGRVHVMRDSVIDPLSTFRKVNVEGTVNLARQSAASGVRRFIYLSSVKVNGEKTSGQPYAEKDKLNPQDAYSISKLEAEQNLSQIAKFTGLDVVILRPPLVYGPGVKANFLKMMRWLIKRVPLPFGAIYNKRSLVGLDNLVDLITTCIEHPAAANQIFFAGDGEDLSTTGLLQRLGEALGKPARLLPVPQKFLELSFEILGKEDMSQKLCGSLQVDISKAKNVLGWHPSVSVDEGLKRTAEWYLRQQKYREID